ncbi:MAG TPA: fasciclin domain-containing protein [Phnomibacter sp.]|nr:fasciclin domain-containing protein [Phnomibacter sp.]
MKNIFRNWWSQSLLLLVAVGMLASCNKELPEPTPIQPPPATGTQTISQILAANPNYSFLVAAIARAGSSLSFNPADATAKYTMFAPDNNAFIASGIPSIAVINGMPVASVAALVNYHVMPGLLLKAADFKTDFPNMYMQSALVLSSAPPLAYRMSIFPRKHSTGNWVNNLPITSADVMASNGVMHGVPFLLSPPTQVIAQILAGNANFTYLMAAIARGDAGPPPGGQALLPLLSNGAANFTLFAPTNQAFNNLFAALGLPQDISTINALPTQQVWGIVAFHLLLNKRAFFRNFPDGQSTFPSLIGVPQQYKVSLAAGTLEVRGPANLIPPAPGTPYYAKATAMDAHAVNGVVHTIDAVLLPQ